MEKRILELALETLEKHKAAIDAEIADIRSRISGAGRRGTAQAAARAAPKRRTMSAAQRKVVSKRMKAYWAKKRAATK